MIEKVYTLMPADVLTVTVPYPTTLTVNMKPSGELWDRVEAQTIEGLRKQVSDMVSRLHSQNSTIEGMQDEIEGLHTRLALARYRKDDA